MLLFVVATVLWWGALWGVMTLRAGQDGHGIGAGDGVVLPYGQRCVDGFLDGRPAVPAAERFRREVEPSTRGRQAC